jgi:hypothetical protein
LLFNKDIDEVKVTINDGYSNSSGREKFYYGPRNVLVALQLSLVRNPLSSKQVAATKISTIYNGKVVDTGSGADTFAATPGTLAKHATDAFIVPLDKIVNRKTEYTFAFETQNDIPTSG